MSSIEEHRTAAGKIIVVDDNPANLKLLEDVLREKGYEVRSFPLGRLALAAVTQNPPDLVLLDVDMPEMNGYEVCERLKSIEALSDIPVLFISAMDQTEDKIKGFRSGGVDYISKPFQSEEIYARVETHLKLRRAQRAERELLEQTLNGAIRMLADLVHAASPELAARSRAIRDCVTWITERMGIPDAWQYDLAATLSLLGCLTLPDEIFQKGYRGDIVSPEEEAIFRGHPHSAARLLENIPRLESIAGMIRLQHAPWADPQVSDETKFGARLLLLAMELDRRIYQGLPFRSALLQLRSMPGQFDPAMLAVLDNYSPVSAKFHRQTLLIKQLFPGMALEDDVVSESTGIIIFRKETILNSVWVERLGNFAEFHGIKEPLRVRTPGPASAPSFQGSFKPVQRDNKDNIQ